VTKAVVRETALIGHTHGWPSEIGDRRVTSPPPKPSAAPMARAVMAIAGLLRLTEAGSLPGLGTGIYPVPAVSMWHIVIRLVTHLQIPLLTR
jgi:hypothetical protein